MNSHSKYVVARSHFGAGATASWSRHCFSRGPLAEQAAAVGDEADAVIAGGVGAFHDTLLRHSLVSEPWTYWSDKRARRRFKRPGDLDKTVAGQKLGKGSTDRAKRKIRPGRRRKGQSAMLGIPRRHSHFVFGVIQSGLTSFIAAGVASFPLWGSGRFLQNWMLSWLISWAMMLPAVLFAAPAIRSLSHALTYGAKRNQIPASCCTRNYYLTTGLYSHYTSESSRSP